MWHALIITGAILGAYLMGMLVQWSRMADPSYQPWKRKAAPRHTCVLDVVSIEGIPSEWEDACANLHFGPLLQLAFSRSFSAQDMIRMASPRTRVVRRCVCGITEIEILGGGHSDVIRGMIDLDHPALNVGANTGMRSF